MKKPVHYDIAEIETAMRASRAQVIASGRRDAKDARESACIDLQESLCEQFIAISTALPRFRNEGADDDVAATALGGVIGGMIVNVMSNLDYAGRARFGDALDRSIAAGRKAHVEGVEGVSEYGGGVIGARAAYSPKTGGNA